MVSRPAFSRRAFLAMGSVSALAATGLPAARGADAGKLDSKIKQAQSALNKDALLRLTMDLVAIASPNGYEKRAAEFLHDYMDKAGISSVLQSFAPDRANAIGTLKGAGGGHSLMLQGHLETGPDLKLLDAMPPPKIIGEEVSGIGVWNMKGPLAAYVAAVEAIQRSGIKLRGDVIVAGTAGAHDEIPVETRLQGETRLGYGIGAKYMLDQGVTADFGVVSEPTSFKIARQIFGTTAIRIDVQIKGKPFDGSFDDFTKPLLPSTPQLNAVDEAAAVVQALKVWAKDYQQRNMVEGSIPRFTISAIEGGKPWIGGAPQSVSLFVWVGTVPGQKDPKVLDDVQAVLRRLCEERPHMEARAERYLADPGPLVESDSPIVTALQAAHTGTFGKPAAEAIVSWHSDAGLMAHQGIPSVTYGPSGRLIFYSDGRAPDEFMRIDDLVRSARIYVDLIVRICGLSKA